MRALPRSATKREEFLLARIIVLSKLLELHMCIFCVSSSSLNVANEPSSVGIGQLNESVGKLVVGSAFCVTSRKSLTPASLSLDSIHERPKEKRSAWYLLHSTRQWHFQFGDQGLSLVC
jgi:hypothetical protein